MKAAGKTSADQIHNAGMNTAIVILHIGVFVGAYDTCMSLVV